MQQIEGGRGVSEEIQKLNAKHRRIDVINIATNFLVITVRILSYDSVLIIIISFYIIYFNYSRENINNEFEEL